MGEVGSLEAMASGAAAKDVEDKALSPPGPGALDRLVPIGLLLDVRW